MVLGFGSQALDSCAMLSQTLKFIKNYGRIDCLTPHFRCGTCDQVIDDLVVVFSLTFLFRVWWRRRVNGLWVTLLFLTLAFGCGWKLRLIEGPQPLLVAICVFYLFFSGTACSTPVPESLSEFG